MARAKGRDKPEREKRSRRRDDTKRRVYVYSEGKVTEREYIDIILEAGTPTDARHEVDVHHMNESAEGDDRKPFPMVKQAVRMWTKIRREAEDSGLDEKRDWNFPQVWVLFDRDDHKNIREAHNMAEDAGVRVAYSHPCFELWRLLHYQNYTSTFGGVCGSANGLLRGQPGFAQTYGAKVQRVSEQQSKHMHPGQIVGKVRNGTREETRYDMAKRFAKKIKSERSGADPNKWDPYTDVWCFVEDGLLLSGY
jgi:hypothetical protein